MFLLSQQDQKNKMMQKFIILLAISLLPFLSLAQAVKFGRYTKEEIDLIKVDYESDASAVVLYESGDAQFVSGMLETTYLFRVKILTEAGKEYADVRVRYYVGDDRTENVFGEKAQITNFTNGIEVTTKVEKDNFYDVDLGGGYREFRISFPNALVGSILEYSYKKSDKNITFLDGWTFQNPIPTLVSKYRISIISQLEYKMIGQGQRYYTDAEKTSNNGTFEWTLRNLYAMKAEPFMVNYQDYAERVEFQLAQYQTRSDGYSSASEWKQILDTWEKLGDGVLSVYQDKGYYRSNPIEKEMMQVDLSGDTQTEKAKKAYYFLRDNFVIKGEDWIYPEQNLPQLLKSKTGSPSEMNLALMGLLKSMGISCDPILIGSKGNGRSDLVPFPFMNQFDEILLYAELDGKSQYLDLIDPMVPFGYVDLDKHVKAGLLLQKDKSTLVPLDFQHNSNIVVLTEVSMDENLNLILDTKLRNYNYKGLEVARYAKSLTDQKKPLSDLFRVDEGIVLEVLSSENQLQEKNCHNINFKRQIEGAGNEDLIAFSPLDFSTYSKNPFTQEYRVFPVDFGYAFSETYLANVIIPDGYEVDDYPTSENLTIPSLAVTFIYDTQVTDDMLKITAKVTVRSPLIGPEQYGDLKYLMESVASKLSAPIVLKKKVNL
jgi:lipocalin